MILLFLIVLEGKRVINYQILRWLSEVAKNLDDVPSYASIVSGSAFSTQSVFTSKTGAFENNDFSDATVENTTVTPHGTKVEIPGWDVYLERVDLGPVKAGLYQETIGGHPTPNDPTPNS